jgi:hypothetical protein
MAELHSALQSRGLADIAFHRASPTIPAMDAARFDLE